MSIDFSDTKISINVHKISQKLKIKLDCIYTQNPMFNNKTRAYFNVFVQIFSGEIFVTNFDSRMFQKIKNTFVIDLELFC